MINVTADDHQGRINHLIVTSVFKVRKSYPFYIDIKWISFGPKNCICCPFGLITLNNLFWFRPFFLFVRLPSICRTPKENAIYFQFSISERKHLYHMFSWLSKIQFKEWKGILLNNFYLYISVIDFFYHYIESHVCRSQTSFHKLLFLCLAIQDHRFLYW